ncbi:MAG: Coenzyme F420 hydrogenase/dehydrogenase, beta subunit C-terminal domain [Candidatus Nanopelagicales bacterium]
MELADVLASGNCSGCGACVLAGASERMDLNEQGDLRPVLGGAREGAGASATVPLESYCPALKVMRPKASPGSSIDDDFGPWVGVWSAHATDPETRTLGSSGGALTALVSHLLAEGVTSGAAVVRAESGTTRSQAVLARTPDEALQGASSRYAPVSTLAVLAGRQDLAELTVVARPCEASALRALVGSGDGAPTILSFFCAGVPTQLATDALVVGLGADPDSVQSVKYRGDGWPGEFVVTDRSGAQFGTSYEQSWGNVLGRRIQPRCKVCVDGVGESADVVAGDLWEADANGYPIFAESAGNSVLIARTSKGRDIVEAANRAGRLAIYATDLEQTRAVQKMQVDRRRFLVGRLAGRRLAGVVNPRFRGFGLWRRVIRDPVGNLKQARGAYFRSRSR